MWSPGLQHREQRRRLRRQAAGERHHPPPPSRLATRSSKAATVGSGDARVRVAVFLQVEIVRQPPHPRTRSWSSGKSARPARRRRIWPLARVEVRVSKPKARGCSVWSAMGIGLVQERRDQRRLARLLEQERIMAVAGLNQVMLHASAVAAQGASVSPWNRAEDTANPTRTTPTGIWRAHWPAPARASRLGPDRSTSMRARCAAATVGIESPG